MDSSLRRATTEPTDTGSPTVGYTCSYIPVELLHAAGFTPRRIIGRTDQCQSSNSLLSGNLCPYIHALFHMLHDGGGMLDGMVIADSCDAMRSLYQVLALENGQGAGFDLFSLSPPRVITQTSIRFYADQLRRLFTQLTDKQPGRNEQDVIASIRLYDRIRSEIEAFHASLPYPSECAFSSLKQRLYTLPPEAILSELEQVRRSNGNSEYAHRGTVDIAVLGSPIPGTLHLSLVEKAGFSIATHDSCLDLRWEPEKPGLQTTDPFMELAFRYLRKISCPRMQNRQTFLDAIIEQYRIGKIGGIIHFRMPFCDLHGFDYAGLLKGVGRERIIQIETDGSRQSDGQIATRIQAFYEVLEKQQGRRGTKVIMTKGQQQICCGIDVGSATVDGALIDAEGKMIASGIKRTGPGAEKTAHTLFKEMIEAAGLRDRDVASIVATGYGREAVGFAHKTVTEITCHAKGAVHVDPRVRFVIDIGGQDSKVIKINDQCNVSNFQMNDKCAAGTGRFIDVMAGALELDLDQLNRYGLEEGEYEGISSVCTVFAESEVVTLIARGVPVPNIARGIFFAISRRIGGMVKRVGLTNPVLMTGGGALNRALVKALEQYLETHILVPEHPQLIGALGAAVIGREGLTQDRAYRGRGSENR